MVYITVSNTIKLEGLPEDIKRQIKEYLRLENPIYQKMLKRNDVKALYAIPQYYYYYKERDNTLYVGRGNFEWLLRFFKENDITYHIKNITASPSLPEEIKISGLELRDYQKGVAEKIMTSCRNGVLKLGTGFGKTIIAIRLLSLIRATTLIIVPRNNLLNQFKQEIKKYFNYTPGIIKGSTWDIKPITVASIATLKKRDLTTIQSYFGMVIVDECHTAISDKAIKAITGFKPNYLYGMSATPERTEDDGRTNAVYFTFGDILVDRELPQKKPNVELLFTDIYIEPSYEYSEIIENQINNEERLDFVVNTIRKDLINRRRIMVLTKRVDHYKMIEEKLPEYNTYCVNSSGTAEEKREQYRTLKEMKDGECNFDVILGTYSMLSTGIDIPALDTLVFAGDIKADLLVKQSAGRIMRLFGDKKEPKIIDIVDNKSPILYNQFKKRLSFYKNNDWLVGTRE